MRKFAALSGLLVAILMTLVLVMRLVGRQAPPSPWVETLHLDDCELPCWIGIVPGKTTLEEAKALIKAKYGNLYGVDEDLTTFQKFALNPSSPSKFFVELGFDKNKNGAVIVTYVALSSSDPLSQPLGFGNLYPVLGDPDRVTSSADVFANMDDVSELSYPRSRVIVDVKASDCGIRFDRMHVNMPIVELVVWNSISSLEFQSFHERWRGFRSECYGHRR